MCIIGSDPLSTINLKKKKKKYRRARAALLALRGPGDWEDGLRVLDQSDVRALNERELSAQEKDDIRAIRRQVGIEVEEDDVDDE